MSLQTGDFIWYELMTRDPEAAARFYTHVVGWTAEDAGPPDGDYWLFFANGVRLAGLMTMPPMAEAAGAAPGWRGFVKVDDTDAMAARVTGAGGTLHFGPQDIPGVGRMASLTDPQGAAFLLFAPAPGSAPAPSLPPATPGTIGWHELLATDWPSAFEFYAGLFGWTKADAVQMGPAGIYQTFTMPGGGGGAVYNRQDGGQKPSWLFYFNVDSIDAAIARVTQAGGTVLMGPQQVPGGTWIMQGTDPQGTMFALAGPK